MRMIGQTFFTSRRAVQIAGLAVATAMMLPLAAQQIENPPAAPAQQDSTAPQAATPPAQASATISNTHGVIRKKPKVAKEDRVVQSKDTRRIIKKNAKL